MPVVALDDDIAKASESFARSIYEGKLHSKQIHYGLYNEMARKLIGGVMKSFKFDYGYDSPANAALHYMQSNIFAFSAAKNLIEFQEFSKLLVVDGEKIPSFSQFKKKVQDLNIRFNERYLRAEYDSAVSIGQMSAKWHEFEENRDAGEYLEYRTAGDERVRASHKALDSKVFHIDDDILNRIYPPNDWGCRCTMVQVDTPSRRVPPEQHGYLEKQASVPRYFKNNPGKTGMVYEHGHPYFKNVLKGQLKQLKAVDNYNMKPLRDIYTKADKLAAEPKKITSLEAFVSWFHHKTAKTDKQEFFYKPKAVPGTFVTFDEDLYRKTSTGRKYLKEKRYQYVNFMEETLIDPDEVWSQYDLRKHGSLPDQLNVFLKFYEDVPFAVVTKLDKSGKIRIVSFYQANSVDRASDFRKGILLYRK